eukprot:m.604954 g.604954  ORF g.604954 m.604954 type:complete len:67 (-) comp58107_c0_seq43:2633-2833(-)
MGKSLLSSRFCVSAHWLFLSVRHSLLSLVQSQQLDSVLAIPTVAQIAFEGVLAHPTTLASAALTPD